MTRKVFKNGDSMTFHDDCAGLFSKYEITFGEPVNIRDLIFAIVDKIDIEFEVKEEKDGE